MRPDDLCEMCGRPERGYSLLDANVRASRVRKGRAKDRVESFLCSRCTAKMLRKGSNQAVAESKGRING